MTDVTLPQKIEILPAADLVPYARNSRTHDDAQVAQIAASIKEFGFTNPILIDEDGGIIAGHGRLSAARKLGIDEVPCLRLGHLTDAQKRAYVIADNRLALNAGWDEEMLKVEFAELGDLGFDLELTGFDAKEIDVMLDVADFAPASLEEQGKLDEKKIEYTECKCPECGHAFVAAK